MSLGNLGGATVQCATKRIETGFSWDITCLNAQNAIIKHDKVKYGLMSSSFPEKIYCSQEAIEQDEVIIDGIEDCSTKLNKEYIESEINKCEGKRSCQLDMTDPTKFILDYQKDG